MTIFKSGLIGSIIRKNFIIILLLTLTPILTGYYVLNLWHWDFSVPLVYGSPGADEIWQLITTKTLVDTGWVLENQFMGAPSTSTWYGNSASQISILHSLGMLCVSLFWNDAVAIQQYYFVINFALISLSTYTLGRVLNINKMIAFFIAIIYSLTSYRFNGLFFAYLANYFMIPLSLIPVYWVLHGKYKFCSYNEFLSSRYLMLGIIISALVAISDGYYSFFYLLLLGFTLIVCCVNGGLRFPSYLLAPITLIFITIGVSLIVTSPLREHRANFPHEANQDQMKQANDAEVYTPTLKLLITPIQNHRLDFMNSISTKLIETANFNRRFPYAIGAPAVLGIFGSILLLFSLLYLLAHNSKVYLTEDSCAKMNGFAVAYFSSLLALFILLCSISGGLGTLVAMVFPSIRAYERFPIFLILVLYTGAGSYISEAYLKNSSAYRELLVSFLVCIMAVIIVLDQTQKDQLGLRDANVFKYRSERFLAEREFINDIENQMVDSAAVYQYPYSQFLSNNKYYGWGQFGQVRAYLHSKRIRWSNGAAKDSYIDVWHEKRARLPIPELVSEMQAAGFDGILVDRLVVKDDEFSFLNDNLSLISGGGPVLNSKAQMAFWKLPKFPLILKYDEKFQEGKSVTVLKAFDVNSVVLPRIINKSALGRLIALHDDGYPFEIDSNSHPEVFNKSFDVERGLGWIKLDNLSVRGGVNCDSVGINEAVNVSKQLEFFVENKSDFDWEFDEGKYPIGVGLMFRDKMGGFLMDSRVKVNKHLKSNESIKLKVNLSELINSSGKDFNYPFVVNIKLVQEGNRWFDSAEERYQCSFDVVQ